MQLSKFSDYALRVVVHLAASPDQLLSTRQIASIHDAKYNHMAKVTTWLVTEGYAESLRGRGGGLRLAQAPAEINLGHLLRKLEADKPVVECLGVDGMGSCRLMPACGLSSALGAAQEAFYSSLDQLTLDKVIQSAPGMKALLATLNTEDIPP
ncbi:RrF2 family transcriptional regulator [Tritonibacter multivorans]|nr:Rrf2 family transcriptional regulator [Tritonibacter multivorans]MDA7422108.1 Rrf2 family transcriptional regulator [Tritonibacter multivorans]